MGRDELKKQIEALLFSSGRKMDAEELAIQIGISSKASVKQTLSELKNDYDKRDSPIMVFEEGDFWKLTVREQYLPLVRKINPYTEFSKTVMETLAVIAWKQPILQSTVTKIRTNKAYDHISELIEMGFVVKEKYGRTYLLKLTQKFYDYFDLQDNKKLKEIFSRFKDEIKLDQRRMGEFDEIDSGKSAEKENNNIGKGNDNSIYNNNEKSENNTNDSNNTNGDTSGANISEYNKENEEDSIDNIKQQNTKALFVFP